MRTVVVDVLYAYTVVLILWVVLSWFPMSPGSAITPVYRALESVCAPVLRPLRRLVPPERLGGWDLSPLIAIIVIRVILVPLILKV